MDALGTPLRDWLTRVETYSAQEIDLGLERVERLLDRLALRRPKTVFHVAGTNGKGSSVAMLESLLHKTGTRVGSYTSPHIRRYNERIRVDGSEASDEQIIAAFEQIEALREDEPLTYFEYGTLAALLVFADAGIDTAILEVGMGGRLDAVNAIEPDAGLITNVALDHCNWLGNDVETIALEKAGIMRKDKPIVFGSKAVPKSIFRAAEDSGAQLVVAGRDYDWTCNDNSWSWRGVSHRIDELDMPALSGEHQIGNAAAVLALLEASGNIKLLDRETVNDAFTQLSLDGRMQEIDADVHWLLDVAHNPAAAKALADALQASAHAGQTVAIFAMLDDKDVDGVVLSLAEHVDHWIAVTADSPRAIDAGELARQVANAVDGPCLAAESLEAAMHRARELTTSDDTILVTGSFYVVGPVLTTLYSRR